MRTNFWSMGMSHSGPCKSWLSREEEIKKPSCIRFIFEQVNEASGDPIYLTDSYLYLDQNVSEQDEVEIVMQEKFSLFFHKKGKNSESEFAGMANTNIDNAEYDLEEET